MNDYVCLDLPVIKKQIADLASIKESQDFIMAEEVIFNPLHIKNKALETKEALNLLLQDNIISFDGIKNVNELLQKADKGLILEGNELKDILVFHHHCGRIKKQFTKFSQELSLKDYTDSIKTDDKIFNKVESCIDNSGQIKEDATDRLKQINRDIANLEKELYSKAYNFIDKHASSLQEPNFYIRNERLTFLFKNSDKNKFQGYQYGTSASGLATYVEPGIFIDLNNRKISLGKDKEDEIERILRELSYLVSSISDLYYHNFDSLLKLCVIFAKAQYGLKRNGIIAQFVSDRYFAFEDLCHPLIDEKKVVANSYRLFAPYLGIVICGSNTGGKTVSLKAIGLSILMSYLGIPIIASHAEVPFYDQIFVDIDDNQSIADSLSTFSAHVANINEILSKANGKSLILIDELISGTDPKEAQAISLAIMDKIKELQAIFVITTHFDDIKKYSYEDENILLSSVGFNMETLSPTYHYLENTLGSSNAIEIASRYFSDQEIINKARTYLKKNKDEKDELLDKLGKQIQENEAEKEKLTLMENELAQLGKELEEKNKRFDAEKEELRNAYIKELDAYIDEMKKKALKKLEELSQENKDKNVLNQIEAMREEPKKETVEDHEFVKGDNVRINDNEQIGTIISIQGNKAVIDMRGMTIKVDTKDLKLMPKNDKKKKTNVVSKKYAKVASEINVIGERVEDALPLVEHYLDQANAAKMSSVKVIHGIGTGALRNAIRSKMKKLSYIKSFGDGDYYDGGSAVTIVVFK